MNLGINLSIGQRRPVAAAAEWTQPAFSNAIDWWRADLGFSLTAGKLSAWIGQGPAVMNAVQGNPLLQHSYTAASANLNGQAAVICDASGGYVAATATYTIKEVLLVLTSPLLTFDGLRTAVHTVGGVPSIHGNTGTADWRTASFAGTRYRDGVLTNAALSTANAAHCYRQIITTPDDFTSLRIGSTGTAGQEWGGEIAELVLLSGSADVDELAMYYAYVSSRYGIVIS